MRLLIAGLFLTGSALLAQQPSATGFGRVINSSGITPAPGGAGFGRMIYPGTGGPPATIRPNAPGTPGTPGTPGGRGRGGRGGVSSPPPVAHSGSHNGGVALYPVYYGGYYYPYDAPLAPSTGYEFGPQYDPSNGGEPSPVVIINQSFRPDTINPVVRDYSNTPLPQYIPQPQYPDQPTIQPAPAPSPASQIYFLIAMKDGSIYTAVAFWVDRDTLNYTTREGAQNRISLQLVNREFSKQLNKERNVDFDLPEPASTPAP